MDIIKFFRKVLNFFEYFEGSLFYVGFLELEEA